MPDKRFNVAGLQNDCPFRPGANGQSHLAVDDAEQAAAADFEEYAFRLNTYLQVPGLLPGAAGRGLSQT